MAPHDTNPAVYGVRLRIAKLSATGAPVSGASSGFISGGLIELRDTPQIDAGQPVNVRLADGTNCVDVPGVPTVKWRDLELTICGVEDEHFELLEQAMLIQSGGNTIGHADPVLGVEPNPNGVALEVWSKMIVGGVQDATYPWLRTMYPLTIHWIRGQQAFLAGHVGWVFTGKAFGNSGMRDTGPFNDWTGTAGSAQRVAARYRTATAPPTAQNGYVAVP